MNTLNLPEVEPALTDTDEVIENQTLNDQAIKNQEIEDQSESIEAEPIQPKPIQFSQPVAESLNSPTPAGLESKIDGLVEVMTQFVQLQMAQRQPQAVQPVPVTPSPTSSLAKPTSTKTTPVQQAPVKPSATEQGGSEEAPKRRYKTGADEATINAAINAIMAHNNAQELHDLKWAITINTLKAFSKNQRVIERILGKGKDNPDIERIVGEREQEIEQHHQQHQIGAGHNNRHKRKRKIGDVIQWS